LVSGSERPCLEGDIWKFLDGVGIQLVQTYFDPTSGFRGSEFDTLAGGGDAADRKDVFSAEDLVAVTLLEMTVPGDAALALLHRQASEFSALLSEIPANVDLWNAPENVIGLGSPAARLWTRLMAFPQMGWVTTSKLLARKRPRLLPVYDTVVKAAVQPNSSAFWLPLREELQDQALIERLKEIHVEAGLKESVRLLRVLDVAIWMRNRKASNCQLAFSRCRRWS
jgi:hypothetical protein